MFSRSGQYSSSWGVSALAIAATRRVERGGKNAIDVMLRYSPKSVGQRDHDGGIRSRASRDSINAALNLKRLGHLRGFFALATFPVSRSSSA